MTMVMFPNTKAQLSSAIVQSAQLLLELAVELLQRRVRTTSTSLGRARTTATAASPGRARTCAATSTSTSLGRARTPSTSTTTLGRARTASAPTGRGVFFARPLVLGGVVHLLQRHQTLAWGVR